MPTETLPTRKSAPAGEKVSHGFAVALGIHGLVFAALFGAAYLSHRNARHWGSASPMAGAIEAKMVDSLPLPPKQHYLDKAVVTSDKPSIAPTPTPPPPVQPKPEPAKPKPEPPPKPNEVLLPTKAPPPKPATVTKAPDKPVVEAPKRVPPAPPTPKATTGETAGVQIPQSVTQLKNGTATVTVEERAFGDRYAYYVKLVSQKINASKQEDRDAPDTKGKRTVIRFTIDRDGTPVDPVIETRSGSASLDVGTLRAIQRIDTFGPLPSGDHITIAFGYTSQ